MSETTDQRALSTPMISRIRWTGRVRQVRCGRGAWADSLRRLTGMGAGSANDIDLCDQDSEATTERELAWSWLMCLESRVAELEELMGVPYSTRPAPLDSRVDVLEDLADALPTLYQLRQQTTPRGQAPLW